MRHDFKASAIIIGGIPNQLVTIPMTIGYIIILKWWNTSTRTPHDREVVRTYGADQLPQSDRARDVHPLMHTGRVDQPDHARAIAISLGASALVVGDVVEPLPPRTHQWLWRCATYEPRERIIERPQAEVSSAYIAWVFKLALYA